MRTLKKSLAFIFAFVFVGSGLSFANSGTYKVPNSAINHIIHVESRGNPHAVSPVGAQGLMQIMPATARDPGYNIEPLENPWDPEQNRRFGRQYFSALLSEFGSVKHALMAYNWGPHRVRRWIRHGKPDYWVPDETKRYVRLLEEPVRNAIKRSYTNRLYVNLKKESQSNYTVSKDGTRWQTEIQSQSRSTSKNFERALLNLRIIQSLSRQEPMPSHLRILFSVKKEVSLKEMLKRAETLIHPPEKINLRRKKPQYLKT